MQINDKLRKPWNSEEKKLSLALYYKSPSTYKYMRRNKITLPGESTVRHWLHSINYSTGFPKQYLEQIKLKTSEMNENEKKCAILLDEVSIMKTLEYNKVLDEIEGYEDLGTLGRKNKLGSHALVVMVRGLYNNWKLPLCYFFTGSGVKGDDLVIIIEDCIKQILDLDLLPTCIICDQGTQNRRMYTLLGGNEDQPSTTICGKKIFLIYDMPHLIKSVRNNLLSGNFQINTNKIVSLNDIRMAYEIDIKNMVRAMIKITPTHLNPNPFQKMNCKLAIQLFSHSVSATIKTCIATGEIKSQSAINTANFIEVVNNMFDSANSKILNDPNPNRKPLCTRNPQVMENLEKANKLFKNSIKICHKMKTTSTPPCFVGIVWTTTAIRQLYESEKLAMMNPNKEYFLMTNRLTQDALENFFSIMRQKNGYVANIFEC
jgi:DNA transposase THAP9